MDGVLLLQSFLVGLFCYLGAVDAVPAYGVTGGYYILGRPLVAGLIIGLIFGDVQAGVLCGLAVQGVFIASMHTGGTSASEITYAAYGGIGLAMATTKDPAIAVTLALFIGQTFGLLFYNVKMAGFSYFNRRAETASKSADITGLTMNQIVYPQIIVFLSRVLPVMAAIFFGQGAVQSLLNLMPQVIINIVGALGGILPALGIGLLMNILIKEKSDLIYFLFGFVILSFLELNIIGLVFIAALIAFIIFQVQSTKGNVVQASNINQSDGVFEDDDMF